MLNPRAFENSRPDGIPVLEILPGPDQEPAPLFVPLQRTELAGDVAGPLAAMQLTQVFRYTREQCDHVLEAVYRFPLPGDAAVTGVTVRFGEVQIEAALKERGQAEQEYQQAKQEGRQAALLARESPDVFSLQVAGIQPEQPVTVETRYVQLAGPEGAGWSLRVPLTTSPRYVRSDELDSRHAAGQPLALLRDPGHRFSLDLTVRGTDAVTSSTHALLVQTEGSLARVRLQEGEVLPDRDCVLSWRPRQEAGRPALHVMLHDDAPSGARYFLALAAPPAQPHTARRLPREVTLLVDHSGSMTGAKWQAADWAVKKFLGDLDPADAFALCLFHSRTRWLANRPLEATPDAVRRAVEFLEAHTDSGGTELGVALEQALTLPRAGGKDARHTLIVTDAEVSDAGRILRLAGEEFARPDRRRISVLCIDAAPNSFLARELAERGGGVARFLTSSPEEGDISTALDDVLADWAQPVLTGLRLEVGAVGAHAAGRQSLPAGDGASAVDLGDLPGGRSVWVVGKLPDGTGEPQFRLAAAQGEVASGAPETAGGAMGAALKALYGAGQVLGLEFLIHAGYQPDELRDALARLGYDPQEIAGAAGAGRRLYAENARAGARESLKGLLVRESLAYGVICSETAFVATRTEAGKPVEGTVAVANALPAGWSDDFITGYAGAPAGGMGVKALAAMMPASASPSQARAALGGVRRMLASLGDMDLGLASPASADAHTSFAGPDSVDIPAFLRERGSRSRPAARAQEESQRAQPAPVEGPLFAGVPSFAGGESVLFDSSRPADEARLPDAATFTALSVEFPAGAPAGALDQGLVLLLYVGDPAAPRARVQLADLLRQGGRRPLNVSRQPGEVVRLVLTDRAGAWAAGAPALAVRLHWS